jgi:hypothetical protein
MAMYGWIWRHIPGHWIVKAIWTLTAILFVLWLLFEHVFPWIDPRLPFNNVTVDDSSAAALRTLGGGS